MPVMMVGGTGGTTGGQAGMGGASQGDAWTPMSNLDANGKLIAPTPDKGYQMVSTAFDLEPGQEIFNCFHVETPNDAEFPVGEWEAQMSEGSHHFILYRTAGDTVQSGTLTDGGCTQGFGGQTWLYTQGSPRSHLAFPDAVAMVIQPHERITFDMHYINTTDSPIHAQIALNMYKVKAETYQKAGSQVSFNVGIAIPPNGMQTVSGNCQPVPGANYFIMQTHTHKRGILATITRNGGAGEELVHTTDWEHPDQHVWMSAPFLTFAPGESFDYSCTYMNDRDSLVTVGTSAEANEMCMAEAYYFPADGDPPACN
jgi:copper type II ascorbate-dependent monooxygenase-like protein